MQPKIHPIARLWNLVKEERTDILAIYFFAMLNGLLQLSLPLGIQGIMGFVIGGIFSASLILLTILVTGSVLLSGFMQINQMRIIERIQQRIFAKYSFAFAEKIPRLDIKHTDNYYLPELTNRFFDTTSLQKNIAKLLLDLPAASIQIIFGLIVLCFYHPFFIVFGILLLLLLWLVLYVTGNKGLQSSLEESNHKYAVAGWLQEMARVVKSFKFAVLQNLHLIKANEKVVSYLQARTKHFKVLLFQYKTFVAFKTIVTAGILAIVLALLIDQQISLGQFVAAEIIILMVINAVEKIIINLDSAYDALTAVEKINKLTDKPSEISGTYLPETKNGISLEVRNLEFGYNKEKPVLNDLSFKINAGDKVGISGSDGSGKSTLLKILMGVYHDFNGIFLINDVPAANYNLDALRNITGIMLPYENIFHGTLWENICVGRTNISREYVNFLTNLCGLQSYIQNQPLGYETELDPAGKRLPGNVIKKILLVRALAHQPQLLLLEEPFSGIDEPYKTNVENFIASLQHTTAVIISRDNSFTSKCNQTIHLKKS